jgi:signal peptidase II
MSVLFVALTLLTIDQLTKFIVLKNFHPGESLPVIKDIFHISLVLNKGIAFGVFSEEAGLAFVWIAVVCVIIIVFIFANPGKFFDQRKSTQIFLSLILAGAIGNLIDRIRLGYVVDFLDFRIWPVFNIADSAITIGMFLLIAQMLRHKPAVSRKL